MDPIGLTPKKTKPTSGWRIFWWGPCFYEGFGQFLLLIFGDVWEKKTVTCTQVMLQVTFFGVMVDWDSGYTWEGHWDSGKPTMETWWKRDLQLGVQKFTVWITNGTFLFGFFLIKNFLQFITCTYTNHKMQMPTKKSPPKNLHPSVPRLDSFEVPPLIRLQCEVRTLQYKVVPWSVLPHRLRSRDGRWVQWRK